MSRVEAYVCAGQLHSGPSFCLQGHMRTGKTTWIFGLPFTAISPGDFPGVIGSPITSSDVHTSPMWQILSPSLRHSEHDYSSWRFQVNH